MAKLFRSKQVASSRLRKNRQLVKTYKIARVNKLLKKQIPERLKSAVKSKNQGRKHWRKPHRKNWGDDIKNRRRNRKYWAKKKFAARLKIRLKILKAPRPPDLPLNIDFYRSADGIYTSYWLGKFINTLLKSGKKKSTAKHVYKSLRLIKFATKTSPLTIFLELLDKIKPMFRLRNYIVRRVIIKEFPIAVLRPRRLILAVHWLKEEVRSKRVKFETSLSNDIFDKLIDFTENPKKNSLVKKRNEFTQRTIKAQFNIRYNFRR